MFTTFKYENIPLDNILLDYRNPRIVTQVRLTSQEEVLEYLFEYEDLGSFVKKIANEGKNIGAERPYVVKEKTNYIVVEGNTRIAAYKLLTGLLSAPSSYKSLVPHISPEAKASLLTVDCSIAPDRDALLPIMANAHFGQGDKSKWGYLGSRKAVYDEWKSGYPLTKLAKAFDRPLGAIKELILEYILYLDSLKLNWTATEKAALLTPSVEFNPPVRFLQTSGHKSKMNIEYDSVNFKIEYKSSDAKKKLKHLIYKLVVNPKKRLGATASYEEVFADYGGSAKTGAAPSGPSVGGGKSTSSQPSAGTSHGKSGGSVNTSSLFSYHPSIASLLIAQLMKEARELNCKKFPAAGTFLLRNIIEAVLKHIIEKQNANTLKTTLDLEGALNLCRSNAVHLSTANKKTLKNFSKTYLDYLNLGAHGNLVPNHHMLIAARDHIDQFIKENI